MFKCEKCGKELKNNRAYNAHCGSCGQPRAACVVCGKTMTVANMNRHLESHKKDKICPVCGEVVRGRGKFCSHSCAAKLNNLGVVHNGLPAANCLCCGKKLELSSRKYCSTRCMCDYQWSQWKKEVEENGNFPIVKSLAMVRKYLIEKYGQVCSICGRSEWEGKLIPVVADHIDGNAENNKIENLRLVCRNCDGQLPTFAGRNKGKGRAYRRKFYKEHGYS